MDYENYNKEFLERWTESVDRTYVDMIRVGIAIGGGLILLGALLFAAGR